MVATVRCGACMWCTVAKVVTEPGDVRCGFRYVVSGGQGDTAWGKILLLAGSCPGPGYIMWSRSWSRFRKETKAYEVLCVHCSKNQCSTPKLKYQRFFN